MTQDQLKAHLVANNPPCQHSLGAVLEDLQFDSAQATMRFVIPLAFCHSGDIVQGGFVAAMIDAAMYSAVAAGYREVRPVSTLELKVNYLLPSRAGEFSCTAKIVKAGKSITFIDAVLFAADGKLTATGTSTARIFAPA